MPWIRFVKDFDFVPAHHKGHVTVAYKAGSEKNVTRECAEQAHAAKAAKEIERKGKTTVGKD